MNEVCALPLYHIFAFTVGMMLSMRLGGKLILIPNPRDLPAVLTELAEQKARHVFPAVNTLFNGLANHPDFGKVDWSHLLVSAGGGTAVQSACCQALVREDRMRHLRRLWSERNFTDCHQQSCHHHRVLGLDWCAGSKHLAEAA